MINPQLPNSTRQMVDQPNRTEQQQRFIPQVLEVPIAGMDCAECVRHVQRAIENVPGVVEADVFLVSEKAVVHFDEQSPSLEAIRSAVEEAGYSVPEQKASEPEQGIDSRLSRQVGVLTAIIVAVVLLSVIVGEFLGIFDLLNATIPMPVGVLMVGLAGYPVFRNVVRASLKRQIISHTLMTIGVIAALIAGQWITALLVVFFMRVGDIVESFTTNKTRQAIRSLESLAPQRARLLVGSEEQDVPISEINPGDVVVVRPGEKIPVDGRVVDGMAAVDKAHISGESMPVEVGPGSTVYAATIAYGGSLRVAVEWVGANTTFGRIIQLVEEAEANRGEVQRFADKFSGYFLPLVALIAFLTFIFSRDPMATVAVLVVACSCAIALATPIAMLASIGAGAKKGLIIKGGKYLEALAKIDILLVDKTGTLTLGRPQVTQIVPMAGSDEAFVLGLAASAEKYSEHPVADTLREAARAQSLTLSSPSSFEAIPGKGIRSMIDGREVTVGSKWFADMADMAAVKSIESRGESVLFVSLDGALIGLIGVADRLRSDVPLALSKLRGLGIDRIELITGDSQEVAANLAGELDIPFQSDLLPEDKISIVKAYQNQGLHVVMVGDGVNDAPALAQANVGIALASKGTDIAVEAAHIVLVRDDWNLVPEVIRMSRRTMGVVRTNLGFTGVFNLIGLTLAAVGLLPPVFAAAAQSIPDLGILANSSSLLRE